MKTVEEISKLEELMTWFLTPESDMEDAIHRITDKRLEALLVLEAGSLFGIILDGSFKKVRLAEKTFNETRLRQIINSIIITSSPTQAVAKCLDLTQEKHTRHLPIMVDGELVGIVSMEELARNILSDPEA